MSKNGTIHERITQLVEEFGNGKNTSFASLIGSNEANVRGYKTSVMPKFDFLEKIARCLDIDLKWLLTGEGSMLRSDQTQPVSQPAVQSASLGEDSFIYNMYKEKDAKVEALIEEIGGLKERIRQLESQQPPESEHVHILHGDVPPPPKGLGSSETVKSVHTKKHTSGSDHTFESTNLQTENP